MSYTHQVNLSKWLLARQMAVAGFISRIIVVQTGLTYKQVRKLYQDLDAEGVHYGKKAHSIRSGASLVHNYPSKVQASLLMQLYLKIGGESVYHDIDIQALAKAYRMYHRIRNEISCTSSPRWAAFDISDAWCLARELRSSEAMFGFCNNCECSYFTSINQRTYIECPFCRDVDSRNLWQKSYSENES